jgi:hypothetical protein
MEALLHTEQKLHLHIEQTPLGVMELDLEGRSSSGTPPRNGFSAFSREEVLGKDFRHLIVPESARKDVDAVWEACSRGPRNRGT